MQTVDSSLIFFHSYVVFFLRFLVWDLDTVLNLEKEKAGNIDEYIQPFGCRCLTSCMLPYIVYIQVL